MHGRPLAVLAMWLYLLVQGVQSLPSLWRMHCLMSGKGVVQWGQGKACAPDRDDGHGASVDASCCVFTHVDRACFKQLTDTGTMLVTQGAMPASPPVDRIPATRSLPRAPSIPQWDLGPPPERALVYVVRCGGLLI